MNTQEKKEYIKWLVTDCDNLQELAQTETNPDKKDLILGVLVLIMTDEASKTDTIGGEAPPKGRGHEK